MTKKAVPMLVIVASVLVTVIVALIAKPTARHADDAWTPKPDDTVYRRKSPVVRVSQKSHDAGSTRDESVRGVYAYLRAFQRDQDPRHLGRAQALLAPWWNEPRPPADVALARGILRQASHDFPSALDDLGRVVAEEPDNTQAWLVRATVQTVIADYDGARESCAHVPAHQFGLERLVCVASVDAVTGHAADAAARLAAAIAHPSNDVGQRAWATSCLAEFLVQKGDLTAAKASFMRSLELAPDDIYTRSAYLDVLLAEGSYEQVLTVAAPAALADSVLLRRAIAAKWLKLKDAVDLESDLAARFDASRLRGDSLHEREEARFRLEVQGNAELAVALAKHDFSIQREPADLRILADASCAAHDAEGKKLAFEFVKKHGLEDPFVKKTLSACAP